MDKQAADLFIDNPGLRSILVDEGRKGLQAQGFCQAGAVDYTAFRLANWLCHNPADTPAMESIGACVFRLSRSALVAVTGKDGEVRVNGKNYPFWRSFRAEENDEIEVLPRSPASRQYIAIAGKWNIEPTAGSVTTVHRESLGGHHQDGRPLQAGESLAISLRAGRAPRVVPHTIIPQYSLQRPVDVIPGYQYKQFSGAALQVFYSSQYTLTDQIDRMGYRLDGPGIFSPITAMHSEGINLGAIQIPGDGQPIVMMRDRQTLGGYPKLGCVALYDLPRLAQAGPGETVCFAPIDAHNARAVWLLKERQFSRLP